MKRTHMRTAWGMAIAMLAGCASTEPGGSTQKFDAAIAAAYAEPYSSEPAQVQAFDGSLEAFLDYAVLHRPELKAEVERWRADRRSADAAYVLPDPRLTYGYFFQSVETRVGPQQHKLNLTQGLPWPGKSSASEEVARAKADIGEHRYSETVVRIRAEVASAYWNIWAVDASVDLLEQQVEILKSLLSAARTRVETGQTTIADVGQVELAVSRVLDRLQSLHDLREAHVAALSQAVGVDASELPVSPGDVKTVAITESPDDLVSISSAHPRILAMLQAKDVELAKGNAADAQRYPDFGIGFDYVFTGESDMDVPDSGKDAIVGMVSVSLPIWFDDYSANRDAAQARESAIQADVQAAQQRYRAAVLASLARLKDAERRHKLYASTLIPQAEAVYGSVLGAYEVGRGSVAAIMLAQKDLLELRVAQVAALKDHNKQRAVLEAAVGRPLQGGKNE